MSPGLFKNDAHSGPSSHDTSSGRTPPRGEPADQPQRKKDRGDPGLVSVFAAGLVVEGEIRSDGDVRIEGRVNGNVSVAGEVTVAPRGHVEGDVEAASVVVAGEVEGTIRARESARLVAGSRVNADIRSPRLAVDDGATLNGRVEMDEGSARAEADGGASRAAGEKQGSKSGEAAAGEVAEVA